MKLTLTNSWLSLPSPASALALSPLLASPLPSPPSRSLPSPCTPPFPRDPLLLRSSATVGLAATGTNVKKVNSSRRQKKRTDESPIVRKRLLDNLTISDALNDLFAGLALTGTNVNKENSS